MKTISIFFLSMFASMHCLVSTTPELSMEEEKLISNVQNCIANAQLGKSGLPKKVLEIDGMSSDKVRHLLNNLCALPNTSYLEIGVWKGSTWISALYGNSNVITSAVAIDDWSEFNAPKKEFFKNISKFLRSRVGRFYSENAFDLCKDQIFKKPVTTYFYDGNHSALSQELAFTYYNDVLDDVFVAIVDDWNFYEVPLGTYAAFDKLGYTILYEMILPAGYNGDRDNWWNGLYVAVIRK